MLDVELVYLAGEVVLLDGLSAGNRERKTSFKVLHLVHGATAQTLGEREREIEVLTRPSFHIRRLNHRNGISHRGSECFQV